MPRGIWAVTSAGIPSGVKVIVYQVFRIRVVAITPFVHRDQRTRAATTRAAVASGLRIRHAPDQEFMVRIDSHTDAPTGTDNARAKQIAWWQTRPQHRSQHARRLRALLASSSAYHPVSLDPMGGVLLRCQRHNRIAMHHDRYTSIPLHVGDELRIPTPGQTSQSCPPDPHRRADGLHGQSPSWTSHRRRSVQTDPRGKWYGTKLQAPIPWPQ